MRRWTGLIAVVGVAGAVLTGCSAAVNSDQRGPTISPSVQPSKPPTLPAGGSWLADYGFANGPRGFSVPAGLAIGERVDQPNVVTLIVDADQSAQLAEYLATNLPVMGFEITARDSISGTPSALIFEAPGWQGAFTRGEQRAALTLRRGHGSFYSPR